MAHQEGSIVLAIVAVDMRTLSKANYFNIPCGDHVHEMALAFYELY